MKKIVAFFKGLKGLDIALLLTFGFFLFFHFQMITLFRECGAIPEAYAIAVVSATIGEAGICGWIRTTKLRHEDGDEEGGGKG